MTTEQLKYFLVVEKHMSFTSAAEELSISQPSLSKHIQALEYEMGALLFNRNTRNVTLTAAGKDFLTHARFLNNYYNKMLQSMKQFSPNQKRNIVLASVPVMRIYKITEMIAKFVEEQPNITVDIIEEDTSAVIRSLKSYKVDVAYSSHYNLQESGFNIFPIMKDDLVLIVHKDNHLADRVEINLEEAANENFLFLSSETAVYNFGIDQCQRAGFAPNPVNAIQSNMNIETIVDLVGMNFGVSLILRKTAEYYTNPDVRVIKLIDRPMMHSALITRDENIPQVIKAFIKFAIEFFKELSETDDNWD